MKTELYFDLKYKRREDFMTQDEMKEVDNRLTKLIQNRSEMGDLYSRWEDEETAYKGDQEKIKNRPNSRVNIINANVEGQIASIIEQNIAVSTRGESPADKEFSNWAKIGLEWTLRKNKIKKTIEVHERRRLKFGTGLFKVYFDEEAINGFGLAKIFTPPLTKIFIDNKIKDSLRFQEGEYIAETIRLGKNQFVNLYGEDKANAVSYGSLQIEDTTVFQESFTNDDLDSATLIQWFERHKGKLRLLEFTGDGLLLFDSHKTGEKTSNQKNAEYNHKSYYKYVNDKYPYFLTPLYPEEGKLWGFGDVKLLIPLQNMINDLYDKIRMCARPNLILFDPSSEVDLEDFNENSLEPRPAMLERKAVEVVQWGQVNPAYWQLLNLMHQESQRITRYSDLMIGQSSRAQTATEASIQQSQGNGTTDQKKLILEETLVEVCEYLLGLMMEKYKGAKAFRIAEDKDEYKWIDFRQLAKVPVMKPATKSFRNEYVNKRIELGDSFPEQPEWELLVDNSNNPLTKNVDLDIEISIGAGLPKNKTFLWQMIEKLAGIIILDEQGQQHNLINYEELRGFVKDYLGLPLEDKKVEEILQQTLPADQGLTQSANAPLTENGNPSLGILGGGIVGDNQGAQ